MISSFDQVASKVLILSKELANDGKLALKAARCDEDEESNGSTPVL